MRLIGLTGGIATGKSTVARLLAERGAVVVDSDVLAREVVEPGSPALAEIVAEFGSGVVDAAGRLDRPALGRIVFADARRRRRLEEITHPRIRELTARRVAAAVAAGPPLVVVDVPLLFETGRQAMFEGVLLVDASEEVRLRRLVERDGLPLEEARRRIEAQWPMERKRALATWVIDNSGDLATTARSVAAWWDAVVAAAAPTADGPGAPGRV